MSILLFSSLAFNVVKGSMEYMEAKKMTDDAMRMHKENMMQLEEAHKRMVATLQNLGQLEAEVYREFDLFTKTFERIHNRPEFACSTKTSITLPEFNMESIKDLTAKMKMMPRDNLANLAASGAAVYLLSPVPGIGMLLNGIFSFKKSKRRKNAESTLDKSKEVKEYIDELIQKMLEIRKYSNHYYMELYDTKRFYDRYLQNFIDLIERGRKNEWSAFTENEKLMAENVVLLVALLNRMCKVELIRVDEDANNQINKEEVLEAIKEGNIVIQELNEAR